MSLTFELNAHIPHTSMEIFIFYYIFFYTYFYSHDIFFLLFSKF
jgi:hypothetical protein